MPDKIFVDSNIWIYAFAKAGSTKCQIARQYLEDNALTNTLVVSCQVLNEVGNVLKKQALPEIELRVAIERIANLCEVTDYSLQHLLTASHLREKYPLSYWDSQIVVSALLADCTILVSEDMQSGLAIQNLTMVNIMA